MYTEEGLRCCNICGKPMREGYLFPDTEDHICSEECLVKFYDGDIAEMEADRAKFGESDEVFFYTEWETDYCDD